MVNLPHRLFCLLATVCFAAVTAQAEPDPALHIYLLVGQSNMAGRGAVDQESTQTDPRVVMLTKSLEWKPATDPLHFDKSAAGVGPGLSFGKQMAALNPNVRIGLVPCAVGGTSIKAWVPGAEDKATHSHPYSDMLVRIAEAQKAGVLKGIIWHQGESDRGAVAAGKANYRQLLEQLIVRLREDLKSEVPFIAGELTVFDPKNAAETTRFNLELHALEGAVKNYGCVSAAGLNHKGDRLHYDAPSARELGKRYAAKMAGLQKMTE